MTIAIRLLKRWKFSKMSGRHIALSKLHLIIEPSTSNGRQGSAMSASEAVLLHICEIAAAARICITFKINGGKYLGRILTPQTSFRQPDHLCRRMIFNTTAIVASLPLIAKFFGVGSSEEIFGVESDEESFPTASPSVISTSSFLSFSPTGTCDLECKTDYGKSASRHLLLFTSLCRERDFAIVSALIQL